MRVQDCERWKQADRYLLEGKHDITLEELINSLLMLTFPRRLGRCLIIGRGK